MIADRKSVDPLKQGLAIYTMLLFSSMKKYGVLFPFSDCGRGTYGGAFDRIEMEKYHILQGLFLVSCPPGQRLNDFFRLGGAGYIKFRLWQILAVSFLVSAYGVFVGAVFILAPVVLLVAEEDGGPCAFGQYFLVELFDDQYTVFFVINC